MVKSELRYTKNYSWSIFHNKKAKTRAVRVEVTNLDCDQCISRVVSGFVYSAECSLAGYMVKCEVCSL